MSLWWTVLFLMAQFIKPTGYFYFVVVVLYFRRSISSVNFRTFWRSSLCWSSLWWILKGTEKELLLVYFALVDGQMRNGEANLKQHWGALQPYLLFSVVHSKNKRKEGNWKSVIKSMNIPFDLFQLCSNLT